MESNNFSLSPLLDVLFILIAFIIAVSVFKQENVVDFNVRDIHLHESEEGAYPIEITKEEAGGFIVNGARAITSLQHAVSIEREKAKPTHKIFVTLRVPESTKVSDYIKIQQDLGEAGIKNVQSLPY